MYPGTMGEWLEQRVTFKTITSEGAGSRHVVCYKSQESRDYCGDHDCQYNLGSCCGRNHLGVENQGQFCVYS